MKENGIILVDKPKTWTSHDVVAKIRGALKAEAGRKIKAGHTGTLDPMATGLLIITVGKYCKRAEEFSKLDKTYKVTMILGKTSTTDDSEGEISSSSSKEPSKEEVKEVINTFIGEISQVPPVFSAIKINGQRAYKLARAGKEVEIKPRKVTIYGIEEIAYKYPNISFMVSVSSGTYIRSLVRDIGQKLNVGAYMSDLVRTQVGSYLLTDGRALKDLNNIKSDNILEL